MGHLASRSAVPLHEPGRLMIRTEDVIVRNLNCEARGSIGMQTSIEMLSSPSGFVEPLRKGDYAPRHTTYLSCPAVSH